MSGELLQFQVDSDRQIFEKLFMTILFLLSEFLPEICWEEVAAEIVLSYFVYLEMPELGFEPRPHI